MFGTFMSPQRSPHWVVLTRFRTLEGLWRQPTVQLLTLRGLQMIRPERRTRTATVDAAATTHGCFMKKLTILRSELESADT